jgi:phosphoserine aminotransferase
VRVPNADWIPADREGLTICDATSAAFAQDMDFSKLDVVTFSWQKALGGEAAHGILILSPRAVERLETFTPANRPLPKIFRLTKGGKLMADVFEGATINTVSMICIEDAVDAMEWGLEVGGLKALQRRADANEKAISDWVAKTDWVDFLAADPAVRSNTSVCLKIVDPEVTALSDEAQAKLAKAVVSRLDKEGVAYDIGGYRDAPTGFRIWCGSTVETTDLEKLGPWLDWAYAEEKKAALA